MVHFNNGYKDNSLVLFVFAILLSIIILFIWISIGEHWGGDLNDGWHYMALYEGRIAESPFAYRLLTPFLASLLPWTEKINFGVVTIGSLALTTGIIVLYMQRVHSALFLLVMTCIFWVISYPFIYYGITLIRADAPMLFLLMLVFFLSLKRVSIFTLFFLIILGALSHEMMLICIPALWLDKLFKGKLTGGQYYQYYQLFLLSFFVFIFIIIIRANLPADEGQICYINSSIYSLILYTLKGTGGIIKHFLRIYAAYGPALLFAMFYVIFYQPVNGKTAFLCLFACAVIGTFLANDTLRVMSIIYFPIFLYAAKYLNALWTSHRYKMVFSCIFLQLCYSFTVFLHLRTIESSLKLNCIAGVISIITFVVCFVNLLCLRKCL